jgi:hypothetical protein
MRDNRTMTWRGRLVVGVWAALAALAVPAAAQTPPPDPKAAPAQTPTPPAPLPVNVDKIRTALDRPQRIHISDQNLRFYVEIRPPEIGFMSFVGDYDLMNGPVPGAAITGRDLMNMQTPKEMYSSAGITATDMLQFAATNYVAQTLIRKAADEIKHAKDRKAIAEIQARIDRQLAALMAADKGKAP